jgi:hypothetical protein
MEIRLSANICLTGENSYLDQGWMAVCWTVLAKVRSMAAPAQKTTHFSQWGGSVFISHLGFDAVQVQALRL